MVVCVPLIMPDKGDRTNFHAILYKKILKKNSIKKMKSIKTKTDHKRKKI